MGFTVSAKLIAPRGRYPRALRLAALDFGPGRITAAILADDDARRT